MDADVVGHYLDAVVFLVRELVAHGRGGILIISPDEHPPVAESASYRMVLDFSLGALLRLAYRIRGKDHGAKRSVLSRGGSGPATDGDARSEHITFGALLRSAFLNEAERVIEELGRLTAIDGAVLLSRSLALVAFGVILPVRQQVGVVTATTRETRHDLRYDDLGSHGTRHRAAATYAAEHPGSVVFIASEDGHVSCLLREHSDTPVRLWRLMSDAAHRD